MSRHPFVLFLREVLAEWQRDRALVLGAALAYYTLFALAPLLVLVIAVAGLALGRAAAQGEIVAQIEGLMGPDGAKMIEGMIVRASRPASGVVATLVSLGTMLLGASGVFGQLQAALDQIFGAEASARRGGGVRAAVRQRLAYVGMILGIGFLLLVSLVLSAALAAVHDLLAARLPVAARVLPPLSFGLSFVVVSGLFALVYKVLPAVDLDWRDVWLGAACTAILFTAGKSLIGIYLGRAGATSVYGAAGSLVLVLLWIYYSAQILLLGAEFTEVYSRRWGSRRAAGA
ncbi:MAG: YihY/virulence factor BrkB family protein [Deltaproteobacteria bacterium]|nr:MAG: YihY/virulence factor BrkB family protein [Deltaproteobacteria bacterium]